MESKSSKHEISADEVLCFLAENPNFFVQYPEALDELSISHANDGAISLVERQVAVLRERNAELRRRLDNLVDRAQQNEALLGATQEVIAALAAHGQREDISHFFNSLVLKHFDIDHAIYHRLEEDASAPAAKTALHLLGSKSAISGPLRSHELSALFGVDTGDGSAAIAVVAHRSGPKAFIAVGSSDVSRYGANDGTVFLEYLANVMASLPLTNPVSADSSTTPTHSNSSTE